MSLEPIKIPQNVYIEDRIVGPITLRHIMLLGIGGGISYTIWGIMSKSNGTAGVSIPMTVLACIPFVISCAFAFVRINDLSMLRILFLTAERMNKPTTRTFSPRRGFSIHIRTFNDGPAKPKTGISAEKQESYQRLDDLTSMLDSPLRRRQAQAQAEDAAELPVRTAQTEPETDAPEEATTSILPRLPVKKDRIQASPLPEEEGKKASVSIFRDIVAH